MPSYILSTHTHYNTHLPLIHVLHYPTYTLHYTILHISYTYTIYIVTLQYTTVQAVLSDMSLMCRNAEQYNGPTSPIVAEAKALYTSLGWYTNTVSILLCTIKHPYKKDNIFEIYK